LTKRRRDEKVASTRETILTTAEQLFGEYGIHAVSNRQISEAAGQGNNAAVSYHFGTKADVLKALVARHSERIEKIRSRLISEIDDPHDLRQWVRCAVLSITEHMDSLGPSSWYARFMAQLLVDPAYRALDAPGLHEAAPALVALRDGLSGCLPEMPANIAAQRSAMTRHLITQMTLERETVQGGGEGTAISEDALIDAIVALWQAPASAPSSPRQLSPAVANGSR
jgi:AcrR family transcriptional regulator